MIRLPDTRSAASKRPIAAQTERSTARAGGGTLAVGATGSTAPIRSKHKRQETVEARLVITKAVLEPEKKWKWGFIYQGRRINAHVSDERFNERVEKGDVQFGHGDALKAKLRITKEYDQALGTFVETGMEVVEVLHVSKAAEQTSLDMSSD